MKEEQEVAGGPAALRRHSHAQQHRKKDNRFPFNIQSLHDSATVSGLKRAGAGQLSLCDS